VPNKPGNYHEIGNSRKPIVKRSPPKLRVVTQPTGASGAFSGSEIKSPSKNPDFAKTKTLDPGLRAYTTHIN
jgi:hypothetical protein